MTFKVWAEDVLVTPDWMQSKYETRYNVTDRYHQTIGNRLTADELRALSAARSNAGDEVLA